MKERRKRIIEQQETEVMKKRKELDVELLSRALIFTVKVLNALVSYAAVHCLVMQRSSPRTAAENRTTFLSRLLANQA